MNVIYRINNYFLNRLFLKSKNYHESLYIDLSMRNIHWYNNGTNMFQLFVFVFWSACLSTCLTTIMIVVKFKLQLFFQWVVSLPFEVILVHCVAISNSFKIIHIILKENSWCEIFTQNSNHVLNKNLLFYINVEPLADVFFFIICMLFCFYISLIASILKCIVHNVSI